MVSAVFYLISNYLQTSSFFLKIVNQSITQPKYLINSYLIPIVWIVTLFYIVRNVEINETKEAIFYLKIQKNSNIYNVLNKNCIDNHSKNKNNRDNTKDTYIWKRMLKNE